MLSQELRDFQLSQLQPQSKMVQNDDNEDSDAAEVEEHGEFLDYALEVLEQDGHHEDLDDQNLLDTH